ncbi:hypothetical protein V6N13_118694 [Hibiscus sabdariffa]
MESKWLAMVLLALLMFGVGWTEGCLEEESVALFRLKPFFPFIDYKTIDLGLDLDYSLDEYGYKSGEEKEGSPDCCEWQRVECNPITGRVTHLLLNLTYELQSLSLSGNFIAGCVVSIKMLSKLKNLETLDLSSNSLGNNILSQLAGFTSLKSLRLQDCGLKGSIDMSEVGNLRNLKELYVMENEIESLGSVFHSNSSGLARKLLLGGNEIESLEPSFQGKQELRLIKLEVLALDYNLFNNNIFSSLTASALPNLKFLHLDANRLNGPMHVEDLNALRNLEELTLSSNEVSECAPSKGCI